MSTRYNIGSATGIKSGYVGNPSTDLFIPPCGIEDCDRALFEAFDKQIGFQVSVSGDMKKVPIIFAAGERWAVLKRGQPLRDKNGTLILPLITIMRTTVAQDSANDITGRGINQQTGTIVIKRRLDRSDRDFQQLINRLYLKHQRNVAVSPTEGDTLQLTTVRAIGDMSADPDVVRGGLLAPDRLRNVYEVLTLPSPQYFSATYKVTFWTQYTEHMNQVTEKLISAYLPQGNALRIEAPGKGYWFIATVDGNEFTPENNFDDLSDQTRVIKTSFNVHVPGYILASNTSGAPVPVRRYVSAASVTFQLPTEEFSVGEPNDPYLGADDPTLPLSVGPTKRRDQRDTRGSRLQPASDLSLADPALLALPRGTNPASYKRVPYVDPRTGATMYRYVRSVVVNQFTGETTHSAVGGLDDLALSLTDG